MRHALRTLAKSPGFTLTATLTLALAIGANTAIFSLLNQVLLRSLPVQDPERMAVLHYEGIDQGGFDSDNNESIFSYPFYRDLRERNQVFEGLIARSSAAVNFVVNGQAELAQAEIVSGNFFEVLGVRPVVGRLLTAPDDLTPGGHTVIVLSYGCWTKRFGASTAVLNQTVRINGLPMTVVGVAPSHFRSVISGQTPDLYVPMAMRAQVTPGRDDLARRRSHWISILGRLKPGLSRMQAEAGLAPLYRSILEEELAEMPTAPARFRARFVSNRLSLRPAAQGINQLQKQWKKPLWGVMVMVGLVLLLACANVANLLISRAAGRGREIAIRLAMGATRWLLIRQLLVESLVLSFAGGLLGVLFSYWITDGLIGLAPADSLGGWLRSEIDLRVLAFSFGLTLLTGILFGLVPAISAARPDVTTLIKEQGATLSKGQVRLRRMLIAGQVALSLVLLMAAGLFVRSLANLLQHDPGFRAERLLVFTIRPLLSGYQTPAALSLIERLQDRMASLPGVVSAGASELIPLGHNNSSTNVTVEGYKAREDEDTNCEVNNISPGYFRTLGVPLIAGREFTAADSGTSPKVALINEVFARRFFKDGNPLGRHMTPGAGNVKLDIEIAGVIRNSTHSSLRETTSCFYYLPLLQRQDIRRVAFFVRIGRDYAGLPNQVRSVVQETDSNLPVVDMKWMQVQVEESVYLDRLIAWLAGGFGSLATLLATVGLYGLIAYLAARRTVEIGIRMALGATRGSILRLILKEVGVPLAAGLMVGIPSALALGRLIETQLFGIRAASPAMIITTAAVLTAAALLAAYLPARRAARVDPMVVLRYE